MARYKVQVRSPKSAEDAFAYMADLTNFATWDPGVKSATQVQGDGPGSDAAFDVDVKGVVGPLRLRYVIADYEPSTRFVAKARTCLFTTFDIVTVRSDGDGSVVTYDAELKLNGLLGPADPALGLAFNLIGNRAARGLVRALDGEKVRDTVS